MSARVYMPGLPEFHGGLSTPRPVECVSAPCVQRDVHVCPAVGVGIDSRVYLLWDCTPKAPSG